MRRGDEIQSSRAKTKAVFKRSDDRRGLGKPYNEHAKDGWELDRIVAGETAAFMGLSDKGVLLLVFKKP